MSLKQAALYLRSSKDRAEVSIDVQRRELKALATARGIVVEEEFVDIVESGKDEHRPGFQSLLRAMRNPNRGWSILMALDTSRIARRRHISIAFEEVEAKRHGVQVIYKSLPESDPITEMLLKSILQAMDEWHSLTSRAKGMAGMAENVRQGFRAGGRAPFGYRLLHTDTGAIRDGKPVQKSTLELDENAHQIRRYLLARSSGTPRSVAMADAALKINASTAIGIEWNALTYAGCTVWNVHAEKASGGGYVGGAKRRPRSEWQIQENTHEALIARDQAEQLLHALTFSKIGAAVSKGKGGMSNYLLTGTLVTPAGGAWQGMQGKFYRTKSADRWRYVPAAAVDHEVVAAVLEDMRSPMFVDAMLASAAKRAEAPKVGRKSEIHRQIVDLNDQVSRAMDLALKLKDSAPALRKVDELEIQRKALIVESQQLQAEADAAGAVKKIDRAKVLALLDEYAQNIETADTHKLKGMLRTIVERIELDPVTLQLVIDYKISARSDRNILSMASLRGFEPRLPP